MSDVAISFEDLSYAYQPGRWVFRNYSASINKGQVFSLLGPNGRGKTTLLKLLLGALKVNGGRVSVNGRTAFVPQLFHVDFDYTVLDMVLMGRARAIGLFAQPSRQDEDAAFAALDRFDMAGFARRPFQELSGGQRQMVILARALAAEADILILDEPASSLDFKNQSRILDWIGRLAHQDGLTVVFTTHHPHHALAVADVALLMFGEARFTKGPASVVLTEDNMIALYGMPIKKLQFEYEGRTLETFAPVFGAPAYK
jgi:iron complex transport system ATP-binding protein